MSLIKIDYVEIGFRFLDKVKTKGPCAYSEESFLKNVLINLENSFDEIIRVNEKIYKNLNAHEKKLTFGNIINLVIKYPILLQRPIVSIERNNKIIESIICRPTELINSIFN